jgi:protein-disulfide isomerase
MTRQNIQARRGRKVQKRSQQRSTLLVLGFLGLLIVVIIGSAAFVGQQSTAQQQASSTGDVQVTTNPVPPNAEPNGRAWGPKDAPIQVIEYADYECEACGQFATVFEKEFVEAFAATGQVRFEIRNAPFHGEGAQNAAEGAYCAAEQDHFWPFHDSLFLNQPVGHGEGLGMQAFNDGRLTAIAGKVGMDSAAFGQCLSSDKYKQQVLDDLAATQQAGVQQTPTFVVNGKFYPGVQSAADFRSIFAQVAPDVEFGQ